VRTIFSQGLFLLLVLGVLPASVAAQTVSVDEFLAYQEELRDNLHEDYPKPLSAREWRLFDMAQEEIRRLLEGRISIDELSGDQRVALMNAQERIAAILEGKEDERVVCRRERTVGTHFQRVRCVTWAQLRQEREDAMEARRRVPMWQLDTEPQTIFGPPAGPGGGLLPKLASNEAGT
jgi:hypothetical protein